MASQKIKSSLKTIFKILLSALAIYIVFSKIDLDEVWKTIKTSNFFWLFAAFIAFNISKLISARRLLILFEQLGIRLGTQYNISLYYVGMFYNLFLPGGIGGDGYKVYHLKQRFEVGTRQLVSAVFLDRLSGAAILAFLAFFFAFFAPGIFDQFQSWIPIVNAILFLLSIPALVFLIRWFFPKFKEAIVPLVFWSIGVQAAQIICALCILAAFGVRDGFIIYFVLFLVSSVAAMLPLSFGGIGLRELVFLYASQSLPIDETVAVSLGLVFFLITALASFIGIFVKLPPKEKED